jgi:succinoglycan biosynthesis transport protein ExoP
MTAIQPQLPAPRPSRHLVETGYRAPAIATAPMGMEVAAYEPLIDVHGVLRALYRNRYLILVVLAASLALGGLWTLLSPRLYQATAKVEIGQEVESPLGQDGSNRGGSTEVDRMLQTQVDLLGTRDMASAVLERLASRGGNYAQLARGFAPESLQQGMSVYLPRNSRVVSINYASPDPQVAALMANYYAETLIERNLQTRFNASAYAREFLQRQLGIAKTRLEQSERALLVYARSAGLLDASGGSTGDKPTSLTSSNLISLNAAYSAAQSARIQAQQKWVQAMSTPLMSLPDVLTNPTVQQLSQQRAAVQVKLQESRQKYQEQHPLMQQELASIAELDRQIQATALSVRESIRNQYLQAQRQEQALAQGVGVLKGATLSEQDQSVRYNILKRETDTNRQLYVGLLQRYKQVSAEAGVTTNNVAVVDRAVPPIRPVSPDPKKNLSLAGVGGLLFAFLLVFARERFDTRVSTPEWVDHDVSIRLLGVMPLVTESGGPNEAILNARSSLSEACHSLRTSIELGGDGSMPSSILFTSTKSQEGKSTTALGLAHAFATAGARVLLVDGDLRRPSLHGLLEVENDRGFSDVLAGNLNLDQAVSRSDRFKIDLLTAGCRPDSPAALLDPEKLKAVLGEALKSYDQVIIDGPPVMGIADATRLAAAVTATIFVLKSQGVTREEARFALRHLQSEQIHVVGAVLTMFDARRSLGSTYYTYGYPEPVT